MGDAGVVHVMVKGAIVGPPLPGHESDMIGRPLSREAHEPLKGAAKSTINGPVPMLLMATVVAAFEPGGA